MPQQERTGKSRERAVSFTPPICPVVDTPDRRNVCSRRDPYRRRGLRQSHDTNRPCADKLERVLPPARLLPIMSVAQGRRNVVISEGLVLRRRPPTNRGRT